MDKDCPKMQMNTFYETFSQTNSKCFTKSNIKRRQKLAKVVVRKKFKDKSFLISFNMYVLKTCCRD